MWVDDALFAAFREDHAVLGRGFHDLSQSLRVRDIRAAHAAARRLDATAGAHIAFEERYFYPALIRLLGAEDVERLLREHGRSLEAVREILAMPEGATIQEPQWLALLERSQEMEQHIAECGELFGAMGRLELVEREALCQLLLKLRRAAPHWTDLSTDKNEETMC
jgi:DNA-binding transcriptional MerR regulator